MRRKAAGHGLQLLGYSLAFTGLGFAAAMMFAASSYPGIPTWAFALGAVALAAPTMIAGGRLNARGRAIVSGVTLEQSAADFREQNRMLGLYIGILLLQGAIVAAPLFLRATGLVHPGEIFVRVWVFTWMLVLCAGRRWFMRPFWRLVERRRAHSLQGS